jgi:hypothetical protein
VAAEPCGQKQGQFKVESFKVESSSASQDSLGRSGARFCPGRKRLFDAAWCKHDCVAVIAKPKTPSIELLRKQRSVDRQQHNNPRLSIRP